MFKKKNRVNSSIKISVAAFGIVFAVSGFFHGLFEMLQGNRSTNGSFIYAIGESQKFWEHGNEPAFTIIHNYLFTGAISIFISIIIVFWVLKYLDTKHGSKVFLILFLLLFLAGGGIGQVVFFTISWMFSTLINKPLARWEKLFSKKAINMLAKYWPHILSSSSALILLALEIAVFGYVPGSVDPNIITQVMLISLSLGLILMMIAYVSAICSDIKSSE